MGGRSVVLSRREWQSRPVWAGRDQCTRVRSGVCAREALLRRSSRSSSLRDRDDVSVGVACVNESECRRVVC